MSDAMGMVERVALAIHGDSELAYEEMIGVRRDQARAAIEAMREPTEEMLKRFRGLNRMRDTESYATMTWQHMIDEALNSAPDAPILPQSQGDNTTAEHEGERA